jgi:hypothetical protein
MLDMLARARDSQYCELAQTGSHNRYGTSLEVLTMVWASGLTFAAHKCRVMQLRIRAIPAVAGRDAVDRTAANISHQPTFVPLVRQAGRY